MSQIAEALGRLDHEKIGVRRLAALDLARALERAGADPTPVAEAFAARIGSETDERMRLVMIRALGSIRWSPARPALAALRDDEATPARVHHAALLAHDAIELAERANA